MNDDSTKYRRRSDFLFILLQCSFKFYFHTFSHELQTCDWPRNVVCVSGKRSGFDADDEDHERVPKILVEDVNFGLKKTTITPKASVPVSDE